MALQLLDVNLLLYAYTAQAAEHLIAKEWFEREVSSGEVICIPEQCVHAFLRTSTNQKLKQHISMDQANEIVHSWLERPNILIVGPGPRHWAILFHLLAQSGMSGPDVTDAQIAAIALEYDATVYSADADFSKYGVPWINPLICQ